MADRMAQIPSTPLSFTTLPSLLKGDNIIFQDEILVPLWALIEGTDEGGTAPARSWNKIFFFFPPMPPEFQWQLARNVVVRRAPNDHCGHYAPHVFYAPLHHLYATLTFTAYTYHHGHARA